MRQPRLGRVGYINCLPIFYAIENDFVSLPARIIADHPSALNSMLASGQIEVTAVSSIAYARCRDCCVVLPDLSIASDGDVWSVALLSRVPVSKLQGKRISLTPYSATSVILLQILLKNYYGVEADLFTRPTGVSPWWEEPDATLVIGDEALKYNLSLYREAPDQCRRSNDWYVYDLGGEWKKFTGRQMVYALWVARREFAEMFPQHLFQIWKGLQAAKEWGESHRGLVAGAAAELVDLPAPLLEEYFRHLRYDLDGTCLTGLHQFFSYAWRYGMIDSPVQAEIWRGDREFQLAYGRNYIQTEAWRKIDS